VSKDKILSYIDTSLPLAIELQKELTKRPAISPDSGGEGELDKCLFLEDRLWVLGFKDLKRYDAPDKRAKGGVRPNLIAGIPGTEGNTDSGNAGCGTLWIISHIDVVPPGELTLWKTDPWTVVEMNDSPGRRLIGRGVEDNQQGLISSVLAALAFVKQGLTPAKTVKMLFAADEETGSAFGINWLLENHSGLFRKGDTAIIPDGGSSNGEAIEIAEKNMLWVRFVTKGVQTHGSRPDTGINAHLAGADLALRLHYGLSQKFSDRDPLFNPDYSTFQPTKKEANVPNINTVPGEDVFCMDMRVLPRYPVKTVLEEIDRVKDEIAKKHKVTIEYSIAQSSESPPTSVESPLVQSLSAAIHEIYGVTAKPVGIGGGTVAAPLRRIGMDCAVWAKLNDCAHQPNEYVLLDNIIGDAKVIALLMLASA